jgi:hypothetical protein
MRSSLLCSEVAPPALMRQATQSKKDEVMTTKQNPMRRHAIAATDKWMQEQIAIFERATRELREYHQRFVEDMREEEVGGKPSATPVNHVSWFVNSAAKFTTGNLRLDLAVNHASALALTQPKE